MSAEHGNPSHTISDLHHDAVAHNGPLMVEALDGTMVPWHGTVHAPGNTSIVQLIGKTIYNIRWTMVPMYVALWGAMAGYTFHYFHEILEFMFVSAPGFIPLALNLKASSNDWLIFILELVDMTMIANLVIMITIGGYSTFVKDFRGIPKKNRLHLLDHLDANTLKIKMSMSIVGVTGVHLLKTFVKIGTDKTLRTEDIILEVIIHLVCVVSMLAFTYNSNLMHRNDH